MSRPPAFRRPAVQWRAARSPESLVPESLVPDQPPQAAVDLARDLVEFEMELA